MSNTDDDESLKNERFVIELGELLDERKSDDAEMLFREAEACDDVAKSVFDIVPIITARLTSNNEINDRAVFLACQRMLEAMAKNCSPKVMVLLLLDQMEGCQDEVTFRSLLKPLGVSLLGSGPSRTIDWCARSIKNYIQCLPCPENEKPCDKDEAASMSAASASNRLVNEYKAILSFLEPIVEYSALPNNKETKTRIHLLAFYYHNLFGVPFCYLRHEPKESENSIISKTTLFEIALKHMCLLCGDLLKYHGIIEDRSHGRWRKIVEEECENEGTTAPMFLRRGENVSNLAWANYYYYVLNTDVGLNNISQIYDFRYIMQGAFYLANIFLAQPEYLLVRKGLKIVESVVRRINEHSVGHETLEFTVNRDLFESLTRVMIYCDSDEDRKLALKVFKNFIEIWNYRGRYLVIMNLYETANHSGVFALLTSITKISIIHCLECGLNFFLGTRLERLMKRICRLPNGKSSDLVEISDEIIAALNLVRFLVIRDREDETGIWRIIDDLRKNYFTPIREGIDISRAHWIVKINDLEENMKNIDVTKHTELSDREITISVGGKTLPMMPASEKIKFCRQAINALDVMESILVRVNECIGENADSKSSVIDRLSS